MKKWILHNRWPLSSNLSVFRWRWGKSRWRRFFSGLPPPSRLLPPGCCSSSGQSQDQCWSWRQRPVQAALPGLLGLAALTWRKQQASELSGIINRWTDGWMDGSVLLSVFRSMNHSEPELSWIKKYFRPADRICQMMYMTNNSTIDRMDMCEIGPTEKLRL